MVVAYAGSSCAFSIDGVRMEQLHGIPTVNMGIGAGLGSNMLTQLALGVCRDGDTLVVALEPALITRPFRPLLSASQLAYGLGEPHLLQDPAKPSAFNIRLADLLDLRPDGIRSCTILGKVLLHDPIFRYRLEDVNPSGYEWTEVRPTIYGPPEQLPHLSPDARRLFAFLQHYSAAHHLTLRYSLPWVFSSPEAVHARRLETVGLVRDIGEFMPVLRDPILGPRTERDFFADTSYHLSREGAALRTDDLARQLKGNLVWDEASLGAIERELRADMR
jgi:hypothetical protein